MVKKGVSGCEGIKEEFLKNECYGQVAVKSGDVSICERIKDGLIKDVCYEKTKRVTVDWNN